MIDTGEVAVEEIATLLAGLNTVGDWGVVACTLDLLLMFLGEDKSFSPAVSSSMLLSEFFIFFVCGDFVGVHFGGSASSFDCSNTLLSIAFCRSLSLWVCSEILRVKAIWSSLSSLVKPFSAVSRLAY